MSRFIPSNYKNFTVISTEFGIPITEVTFNRDEISYLIDAPNSDLMTMKITQISSAPKRIKDAKISNNANVSFNWSIYPYYKMHLFDPDHPLYYDIGPRIKLSYSPKTK